MERIFVIPAPGLRVHLGNGDVAKPDGSWTDKDMLVERCVRDGDLTIADPQPMRPAESPPEGKRGKTAPADPTVTTIG